MRTTRAALVPAYRFGAGRAVPAWIDEVLRRAVHPLPGKRYEALSEFVYDLRHPNPQFTAAPAPR